MIGLSVDDGPVSDTDASPRLYDFLKENNQRVTHFMIGINILASPDMFLRAFQELGGELRASSPLPSPKMTSPPQKFSDHLGVHTWTHRYSSLLTNEELVAELGWTLQIIYDSTGGRVPRYWRPPYGDADNRVRAIAKYIFGLTTVVWNQDSEDWTMSDNTTTLSAIQDAFTGWLNGPRSPGLIILEHEITGDDVTAFMNMYPLIATAGGGAPWQVMSISQLFDGHTNGTHGKGWYQNSDNSTAVVTEANILYETISNTTSAPSSTSTLTTIRMNLNDARRGMGSGNGVGLAGAVVMAALLAIAL